VLQNKRLNSADWREKGPAIRITKKLPRALLMMPALLSGWATTAASHEHHSTYSAGEDYSPSVIEVKRGEQIKFIVRNVGTEDHELLLASTEDNLKHAAAMRKYPGMAHDEPNGLRLARKQSGEILWKFTKAGTFEYSCLIPTHREYGMTGKVVVK
jgi:uncharacterized cupredoxin-like copper-binding protein